MDRRDTITQVELMKNLKSQRFTKPQNLPDLWCRIRHDSSHGCSIITEPWKRGLRLMSQWGIPSFAFQRRSFCSMLKWPFGSHTIIKRPGTLNWSVTMWPHQIQCNPALRVHRKKYNPRIKSRYWTTKLSTPVAYGCRIVELWLRPWALLSLGYHCIRGNKGRPTASVYCGGLTAIRDCDLGVCLSVFVTTTAGTKRRPNESLLVDTKSQNSPSPYMLLIMSQTGDTKPQRKQTNLKTY